MTVGNVQFEAVLPEALGAAGSWLLPVAGAIVLAMLVPAVALGQDGWADRPRLSLSLNGAWQWRQNGEHAGDYWDGARDVRVPACYQADDFSMELCAWYRRTFTLPAALRGGEDSRWVLRFEKAGWYTKAVVNGQVGGENFGSSVPFELDVTEQLKWNQPNEIKVFVAGSWGKYALPGREIASAREAMSLRNGGEPHRNWAQIAGDVTLVRRPAAFIRSHRVDTSVRNSTLRIRGRIEAPRGADVAGARFTYLKGDLVLLQNALHQLMLSILTSGETLRAIAQKAGLDVSPKPFVPVLPPLFIKPDVFQRMARLEPREERYHIEGDDLYLIGSAEHTLGPLHMDETLKAEELPLRYTALTSAFRREAGTYGKDMKGIVRLHQFEKMEMESFTLPEQGLAEQNFLIAIQEHLTAELGLAYQVVMTCTGDQGDPDARHLDIETWMPGQGKYRETHSADYMTDYQARRLATKVKGADGKSVFVHTNDATAFAGRTLVAILENYQQADGTIAVPEALLPWMKKDKIG